MPTGPELRPAGRVAGRELTSLLPFSPPPALMQGSSSPKAEAGVWGWHLAGQDLPFPCLAHCWSTSEGEKRGDLRTEEAEVNHMEERSNDPSWRTEETVISPVLDSGRRRPSLGSHCSPTSRQQSCQGASDWGLGTVITDGKPASPWWHVK